MEYNETHRRRHHHSARRKEYIPRPVPTSALTTTAGLAEPGAAFFDARARAEDGAEKSRCPANGESACAKCIFFSSKRGQKVKKMSKKFQNNCAALDTRDASICLIFFLSLLQEAHARESRATRGYLQVYSSSTCFYVVSPRVTSAAAVPREGLSEVEAGEVEDHPPALGEVEDHPPALGEVAHQAALSEVAVDSVQARRLSLSRRFPKRLPCFQCHRLASPRWLVGARQ